MAEGARLESVFTLTCNEGSNPSLSATVSWESSSDEGLFLWGKLGLINC